MSFNSAQVDANPTAFSFTMGTGFKFLGPIQIPSNPVGAPSACEPSPEAEDGSWHRILPPNQPSGVYIRAQWVLAKKVWRPPLEAQGRRVGYSSQYLAAVGWTYGEAE